MNNHLHQSAFLLISVILLSIGPPSLAFLPSNSPRTTSTKIIPSSTSSSSSSSTNQNSSLKIAIIGAGPSGLLLAHRLLSSSTSAATPLSTLDIFESRSDPRLAPLADRAYALGLGVRGRNAIRSVDETLWMRVKSSGFECDRFRLHINDRWSVKLRDNERDGGVEPSVLIYQTDLCGALLEEWNRRKDSMPSSTAVNIHFDANVTHVNLTSSQITIDDRIHDTVYDLIIGCDGANSIVRSALQTYSPPFQSTQRKLPGCFKVARVPVMPPKMDPKSVGLVLPRSMKAGVTAFVEPTVGGGGCILFAGRLAGSSSDDDEKEMDLGTALFGNRPSVDVARVEEMILDQFPLLEGTRGLSEAVQTLLSQRNGIADSVKCNIYHSKSDVTPTAICGDAAHATGGVSGQGCNSALMDAMILADCLEKYTLTTESDNHNSMRAMLHQCLESYSEKQVPEGWALYDLSFGNDGKTLPIFRNLASMLSNVIDSLFQGRWGIGKKPLQTLLASSSTSFSLIRRDRQKYFVEEFPSDELFREMLDNVYK
eukprot:CCRYP_007137-RA/>CCRYP_007137-RA protein AED:0.29 eAED:0.29 QI:0/-1/0/1/-1/1/1/0/539